MDSRKWIHRLLWVLFLLVGSQMISAMPAESEKNWKVDIQRLAVEGRPLAERFRTAHEAFPSKGSGDQYLVGYGFLSRSTSHGCGSRSGLISVSGGHVRVSQSSLHPSNEKSTPDRDRKEKALLYLFRRGGGAPELLDVSLLDMDTDYAVEDVTLYWLGMLEQKICDESLALLEKLYGQGGLRRRLLPAIAHHPQSRAFRFLFDVASRGESDEEACDAIFWLGALHDQEGFTYLSRLARTETDPHRLEKVVFPLYLIGSPEAVRELIRLARAEAAGSVRRQAIFWLGQKASAEAVAALKETVQGDADLELRKQAVFAISQLPTDQAVPMLMEIARGKAHPRLRKEAIFWLGQKGGEEAVKFFEQILLGKIK